MIIDAQTVASVDRLYGDGASAEGGIVTLQRLQDLMQVNVDRGWRCVPSDGGQDLRHPNCSPQATGW
eukprot:gene26028-biopygen13072